MAIAYLGNTVSGVSGDTKPTLTANEKGVIFIETDTNKIYQWDTDSWNEIVLSDASTSAKGIASFHSDNFAASSGAITIKDGGVILGTETTGNYVATVAGTSNEIEVSGSTGAVTIGIPTNPTLTGNATITGNLTVQGDTITLGDATAVNATVLSIDDPTIKMATNNTATDAVDIGFYGTYAAAGPATRYAGLIRDATDSSWYLFNTSGSNDEPTTTLNVSGIGLADLKVGGFVVGHTSQITTDIVGEMQLLGSGVADSTFTLGRWSANVQEARIGFVKSRNATIGSHTIVTNDTRIGGLYFYPDDNSSGVAGVFPTESASFIALVDDGSPEAGYVGTAFKWQTQAGGNGNAITEKMRLTAAGSLTFGQASTLSTSTGVLTIDGDDGIVLQTTGSGNITMPTDQVVIGRTTPNAAQLTLKNLNDVTQYAFAILNDNDAMGFYVTQDSGGNHELKIKNNAQDTNVQISSHQDSFLLGGNLGIGITAPDSSLHVYRGDAGRAAHADAALVLEDDGDVHLQFLSDTGASGIFFGDTESATAGYLLYTHSNNQFDVRLNASDQLHWSDGAFAFQKATTISTTAGALTLAPTTDVIINGDLELSADKGIVSGHTARIAAGHNTTMLNQFIGTAEADAGLLCARFANNSGPGIIGFTKSRNASIGGNTIVQDTDYVGQLIYFPADGVDFLTRAAVFSGQVDDGSPAAGDIGMAFVFEQMPGGGGSLTETFRIAANGDATLAGSLTENSDERLKTNIQPLSSALSKVSQMRGVSFDRLDNAHSGIGLISQELKLIAPEVVKTSDRAIILKNGTQIENVESIAYTKLVAYLVEAVKELKAEVDELKNS